MDAIVNSLPATGFASPPGGKTSVATVAEAAIHPSLHHRTGIPVQIKGGWSPTDDDGARGPRSETGPQLDHNHPWRPKRRHGEEAPVRRLSQDGATQSTHANAARLRLTPCSQAGRAARLPPPNGPRAPRPDETSGRSSAPSRPTSRATAAAAAGAATIPLESDPACPAALAGPSSPPTPGTGPASARK